MIAVLLTARLETTRRKYTQKTQKY